MLNEENYSEDYKSFLSEVEYFDFSTTRNRQFAQNVQLERWAVMGCIRDYSYVTKYEITTKDFTNVCCRYLLKYAERIHKAEGTGLDKQILESMSMTDIYFKQEVEKDYGSLDRLVSFYNSLSIEHSKIYTKKFKLLSLIRQTEQLNNNSLAELYDLGTLIPNKHYLGEPIEDLSVEEILDYIVCKRKMDIEPFTQSIFCRNTENLYISGRDPYNTYKDFFKNFLKENPEASMAAPHGCNIYNAATGGAERGMLHLLAMPTNSGKTTMLVYHAASLAYNVKYDGKTKSFKERQVVPKKVLFLTTEQKTDEITNMILAHLSGVNRAIVKLIKKGIYSGYTQQEVYRVLKAIEIMESENIIIENVESLTPLEIIKKIKTYKQDKGIEYIFFDYLQVTSGFLRQYGNKTADHVGLTLFANDLRNLAQDEKLYIETAAQISPSSAKQSSRLDGSCLKGSTGIADKLDVGVSFIQLNDPSEFDLAVIEKYSEGKFKPYMKALIWKNRENEHKNEYLYLLADFGTCNFKVVFAVKDDQQLVVYGEHELNLCENCARKEYERLKTDEELAKKEVRISELKSAQNKILIDANQINSSLENFVKRKEAVTNSLNNLVEEKKNIKETEEERFEHTVGEVFDEETKALETYKLQKLREFFETPTANYDSIDFQELRESIPHEFIYNWLEEHNAEPTWAEDNGVPVINAITICHGGSSRKLKYYTNSSLFKCFTGCEEDFFDIFALICKVEGCGLKEAIKVIHAYLEDEEIGVVHKTPLQKEISARQILEEESTKDFISSAKEISDDTLNTKEIPKHIYPWEKEGISPSAFSYYNIRIDKERHSIILPSYSIDNKLVGVRERSIMPEDIKRYGKYHPVFWNDGVNYRHSLSSHLYGLNWNKQRIQQTHKVIIFEAEKSVIKMGCTYGFDKNCSVATCGSSISRTHVELLCNLGVNEIVIAYDRDYEDFEETTFIKYVKRAIETAKLVGDRAIVSFIVDRKFKLPHKAAPIDHGRLIFEKLLKKRIKVSADLNINFLLNNLHTPISAQTTIQPNQKQYRIYKGEIFDLSTEFINREETNKFIEFYKQHEKENILPELSDIVLDEQALSDFYKKNKALTLYEFLEYAKLKILQKNKTKQTQSNTSVKKPLVGKPNIDITFESTKESQKIDNTNKLDSEFDKFFGKESLSFEDDVGEEITKEYFTDELLEEIRQETSS